MLRESFWPANEIRKLIELTSRELVQVFLLYPSAKCPATAKLIGAPVGYKKCYLKLWISLLMFKQLVIKRYFILCFAAVQQDHRYAKVRFRSMTYHAHERRYADTSGYENNLTVVIFINNKITERAAHKHLISGAQLR